MYSILTFFISGILMILFTGLMIFAGWMIYDECGNLIQIHGFHPTLVLALFIFGEMFVLTFTGFFLTKVFM